MDCRTALATVLDSVDYTAGNCRPNEMVGAVLPKEMIVMARQAIAVSDKFHQRGMETINKVYEEMAGSLTKRTLDGANVCRVIEHVYIDGACAQCGSPEPPRK